MVSPLTGSDGNVEFVVVGRAPGGTEPIGGRDPLSAEELGGHLDAVVADAVPEPDRPGGR